MVGLRRGAKRSINSYHVAYIVRAVTPGSFALPAANVSDMYAPRVYGRTAMGRVDDRAGGIEVRTALT